MSKKEKIRALLDEGLEPKEIAEKVGLKTQTIYHYRHVFKKEEEPIKAEKQKTKTQDKSKEKEERKMSKLERENKTLKVELKASEKELEQEREQHKLLLSKYKELETIANNLQEMKSVVYETQANDRIEELIHENSAAKHMIDTLQEDKDKLTETLYKREQYINELRDDLEAEREKHKYLRSYSMLIMQEEGAANV